MFLSYCSLSVNLWNSCYIFCLRPYGGMGKSYCKIPVKPKRSISQEGRRGINQQKVGVSIEKRGY